MPGAGRLGDKGQVPTDTHGCPSCPHSALGPSVQGSPDVKVNGRPALRKDDVGMHAACCGPNTWKAIAGSATVFINGKPAHRLNDAQRHCGGVGRLIEGSANVIIGDSGGGGDGGGGAAGASGGLQADAVTGAGNPIIGDVSEPGGHVDAATQAETLRAAAAAGIPFCEECERGKREMS